MRIKRIEIIIKGIHRTIGYIDYDKSTYFSKRDKKNLMRSYYGFGISIPILNYLFDEGINNIIIVYDGRAYKTSVNRYYLNGFEYRDGKDKQVILPLAYFIGNNTQDYPEKPQEKKLFKGYYSLSNKPKNTQKTIGAYI